MGTHGAGNPRSDRNGGRHVSRVCLSVVSHGQAELVSRFLEDLGHLTPSLDVILTCNIPDPAPIRSDGLPNFRRIDNSYPKGFGANHNSAFEHCTSEFFCVANPDVRLTRDPFDELIACMDDPEVGLVAPRVVDPAGNHEDSARYFPTPASLAGKMLGLGEGRYPVGGEDAVAVEWVAGMFMLFRAEAFRAIGGFDERFFLYYEDVDICARLWKAGWKVQLHPGVSVIHAAQRTSRRKARYMATHLASMARYFAKHMGRLPHVRQE
jgi:N-acetylglucosaminyl-diphospho-decaprenol L-rhamnosyltransferase